MANIQDCANTLIRDTKEFTLSYRQALSYLSIIDQQTFDAKKVSASFAAMLEEIPVSFDYDEMRKEVSRLLNVLAIDQSMEIHKHVFINSLQENSLEAYKTCVTGQMAANRQLDLSVASASKTLIRIEGHWNPTGANAEAFDQLDIQVVGARLIGDIPKPMPRVDFYLRLERTEPDSEVSCVVRALDKDKQLLAEDEVGVEPYILIERIPEEFSRSTDDPEFSINGHDGPFIYYAVSGHVGGSLPINIGATAGGWRIDEKSIAVSSKWAKGGIGISWSPNPLRCDGRTISGTFVFSHNPNGDGAHAGESCEMKITWIERRTRTKRNGQYADGYPPIRQPTGIATLNRTSWKDMVEVEAAMAEIAPTLSQ